MDTLIRYLAHADKTLFCRQLNYECIKLTCVYALLLALYMALYLP